MSLPGKVAAQLQAMREAAGLGGSENVVLQQLSLTNVPSDDFLTRVYLERAKGEAEDIEETYKCNICGEPIDDRDKWVEHYQEHIISFMAGTGIMLSDEEIKKRVENLPIDAREEAEAVLRRGLKQP